MKVYNYLTGLQAQIKISTLTHGNEILGTFVLNFNNQFITEPIKAAGKYY